MQVIGDFHSHTPYGSHKGMAVPSPLAHLPQLFLKIIRITKEDSEKVASMNDL